MIEVHAIIMHLMNIPAKYETNQPSRTAGIVGTTLKTLFREKRV